MAHGGDIYRNKIKLDFSVNINPLGIFDEVRRALAESLGSVEAYPDQKAEELTEKLSKLIKIKPENIVFGNGASELLMAAVHAFTLKKILIPVPSFYGYEHAVKTSGAHMDFYIMRQEDGFELTEDFLQHITNDTDMLFIANPNNPTGKYISPELLEKILDKCEKNNVRVILDECFMELSDEPEIYSSLSKFDKTKQALFKNLLVLRSFTKTFAIPGLRLGYMVCADEIKIREIKCHLPEWNISSPAQAAGIAALDETEMLGGARRLIKAEREFLEKELTQMGFQSIPSRANYILFNLCAGVERINLDNAKTVKGKTKESGLENIDLYEELLKKQILIRDCSDYCGLSEGWYRIAVRSHGDNEKLIKAIEGVLKDKV
jgi:threonine-phosphate decarboxylase